MSIDCALHTLSISRTNICLFWGELQQIFAMSIDCALHTLKHFKHYHLFICGAFISSDTNFIDTNIKHH